MALSEKVALLGAGLYKDIPDELTLTSIPTTSELDYIGAEDFDRTMLDSILPAAVKEKINFRQLLSIDFQWICRCLRLLNYGPYHTTNAIFCSKCGKTSHGEYRVNLNSVEVKPLPAGFVNDIVIPGDEFLDYTGDIHIQLPTIQETLDSESDRAFTGKGGTVNRDFARICYSIKSMGTNKGLSPIEVKLEVESKMSAADYKILHDRVFELNDYGLRLGGDTNCPVCGHPNATFLVFTDDRFFRPALGDLRQWKLDRANSGTGTK